MSPSERICNCFCVAPGGISLLNHQKVQATAVDPPCPINENLGCKSSGRLALGPNFSGSGYFSLFDAFPLYSVSRLPSLVGTDLVLLYLDATRQPTGVPD